MNKKILYLSLILSTSSLLYCFLSLNIQNTNKTDAISIIGIVITAFAFMLGAYFIVLAVDAYSHLKDIKNTTLEVENRLSEIISIKDKIITEHKSTINNTKATLGTLGKIIDELMTTQIDLYNMKMDDYKNNSAATRLIFTQKSRLYQYRARFAINNDNIGIEILRSRLMDIQAFGDKKDLDALSMILTSSTDTEVKYLAESAINTIRFK